LLLGRAVTLDEARAAVDFLLQLPSREDFAAPAEIYLSGSGERAMVSFVYPASEGMPESAVSGVAALLTQFAGETDRGLIIKGLGISESEAATTLEAVTVNGEPGFWIEGAPHGVFLACGAAGECREERYRLAGNVLLWEQHGLTLRLESTLSREEALAVAASVRAAE
jgi:hypothetical protein